MTVVATPSDEKSFTESGDVLIYIPLAIEKENIFESYRKEKGGYIRRMFQEQNGQEKLEQY